MITENQKKNISGKLKRTIFEQAILIILCVLVIVMSIFLKGFWTWNNLFNMLRQNAVLGIMACGMTIVIISKGIDLSSAAILSLSAIAALKVQHLGYFALVLTAITVGLICGLINGVIIGKIKANFLIVTLATAILFKAASFILSGGRNVRVDNNNVYTFIGIGNIFRIPAIAYLLVAIVLFTGILLHKSIIGRRFYLTGINDKAALASGINVSNISMLAYIINGVLIGISAIALSARLPRIRVDTGSDYLFDVITIVVLGGTSLSGGVGGINKTILGFAVFILMVNGMALLGIPYEFQQLIKGIILVSAVLYDEYSKRRRVLYI